MKNIFNSGITDLQTYQKSVASYSQYDQPCPKCGAIGRLVPYGSYYRHLVSYDGSVTDTLIEVNRFKCKSCDSTHALLPDILIPYGSYSLRFRLNVLLEYFERRMTVDAICEKFIIAKSLLYDWVKLFKEHKDLLLGVLGSLSTPAVVFIQEYLAMVDDPLQCFFAQFGFSFLQTKRKTARSRSP